MRIDLNPNRTSFRCLAPRLTPTRPRARAGVLDDRRRRLRLEPTVPTSARSRPSAIRYRPLGAGVTMLGMSVRAGRPASGSSRHSLAHMPQNPAAACSGIPHGHVAGVGRSSALATTPSACRSSSRLSRVSLEKVATCSAAGLRLNEHPASWTGGNAPSSALLLQDRRTRARSTVLQHRHVRVTRFSHRGSPHVVDLPKTSNRKEQSC